MEDTLRQSNQNKLEFIDFVLSISDNDLPVDKSVQIDFLHYRINEVEECLEERLDIIEKKLNSIMKYLDQMSK
jgi:hypothetical protein